MPRPQPVIVERGRFFPDSPRYRHQPLPLRTAISQLEKLTQRFGEDIIGQVGQIIDLAQLSGAEQYKLAQAERVAAQQRGEVVGPPPKAGLDVDLWDGLLALARGLQGALTGTLIVSTQTAHFLASEVEVEVEIDGQPEWVRLVVGRPAEFDASGREVRPSTLNCDGFDYDLPPADAFPLLWMLAEANLVPLFRAAADTIKKKFGKSSKDGASPTPSSAPAVTDSPVD